MDIRYMDMSEIEAKREQGLLYINDKLSLRYIPSAPVGSGHKYFEQWPVYPDHNGQIKVTLDGGKFYVTRNQVHVNEVFMRLASTHGQRKVAKQGGFFTYTVSHLLDTNEHLVQWDVNGHISGLVLNRVTAIGIDKNNLHEFIFRLYKYGRRDPGMWGFDVFLHSSKLPKIPEENWNNKVVLKSETGCGAIMSTVTCSPKFWTGWMNAPNIDTAHFIKNYKLPDVEGKPSKDDYVSWFREYGNMNVLDAEEAYKFREQVRLP